MEVGSFIELQFPKGKEYYSGSKDVARLNSGRTAIWHSLRVLGCETVWIPYYQCDTVRDFLRRKNVKIKYYHIDSAFNPIDLAQQPNEAVLLVNYYGIMSWQRLNHLAEQYHDVIIDNSQAFFANPLDNCMNVYSARKFIGVPDGSYVIGKNADKYLEEYEQGYSSDTSLFLLQRIEHGCEGKTYASRMVNEKRIDNEGIMNMSLLTRTILDGTDYESIKNKRRENYEIASELFDDVNQFEHRRYYDKGCVPAVYPLVIEDDSLLERLLLGKHFQGHWWSYLLDEMQESDFEYWLSRYMIPITIDQRYGRNELEYIRGII